MAGWIAPPVPGFTSAINQLGRASLARPRKTGKTSYQFSGLMAALATRLRRKAAAVGASCTACAAVPTRKPPHPRTWPEIRQARQTVGQWNMEHTRGPGAARDGRTWEGVELADLVASSVYTVAWPNTPRAARPSRPASPGLARHLPATPSPIRPQPAPQQAGWQAHSIVRRQRNGFRPRPHSARAAAKLEQVNY